MLLPVNSQAGTKPRRLKIGMQDMEIKQKACFTPLGAERGIPMSPLGTPMGGWCWGALLHTSLCPSLKVFVPIHGPMRWSQSCSTDWAQLLAVGGEHGVGHRYGFTSHVAPCGFTPMPGHRSWGVQGTPRAGSSPGRGGDKNVPHPLSGTLLWGRGAVGPRGRILLALASTCCSQLHWQPLSLSPSATQHPAHLHLCWGWPGGSRGEHPPCRQPSSQACCLLLLLFPPGHLGAGRRTIARRMSKMVPIALATHSRAAAARGVRQLPEKRVFLRWRGLRAQVAWQPPPSPPWPTSHARTGSAT